MDSSVGNGSIRGEGDKLATRDSSLPWAVHINSPLKIRGFDSMGSHGFVNTSSVTWSLRSERAQFVLGLRALMMNSE